MTRSRNSPFRPTGDIFGDEEGVKSGSNSGRSDFLQKATKTGAIETTESADSKPTSGEDSKDDIITIPDDIGEGSSAIGSEKPNSDSDFKNSSSAPSVVSSEPSTSFLSRSKAVRKRSSAIMNPSRSMTSRKSAASVGADDEETKSLLRILSNHLYDTLHLLCRNPRDISLANFPSISSKEQEAVDEALKTVWDPAKFSDLELLSFASLTSPPVASTMNLCRTAMFGQVGFTLKAPQDHEAFAIYSLQRLAADHNANFIDLDLRILLAAESVYTDSILQEENKYSSASLFYSDLMQDEENLELYLSVLFEYMSDLAGSSSEPSNSSSNSSTIVNSSQISSSNSSHIVSSSKDEKGEKIVKNGVKSNEIGEKSNEIGDNLTSISSQESSISKNLISSQSQRDDNATFVVVLRGLSDFRTFPHRKFKSLLEKCRENVLFVELDVVASSSLSSGPLSLGPSIVLSPGPVFGGGGALGSSGSVEDDDDDEMHASGSTSALQTILSKLSGGSGGLGGSGGGGRFSLNSHRSPLIRQFFGDGTIDFTHRKIIEADKIKTDDLAKAEHEGTMRIASRLNLLPPSSQSNASKYVPADPMARSESSSSSLSNSIKRRKDATLQAAREIESCFAVLARRELLQFNLKILSACFRSVGVIIVPDISINLSETFSENEILGENSMKSGDILTKISPQNNNLTEISPSAIQTSSSSAYTNLRHPFKHCLSEYWLNPNVWNGPKPESFETTCHLLSMLTSRLQNVERIVQRAIKMQDKYQYQKTGTWNHFSPIRSAQIRVQNSSSSIFSQQNSISPSQSEPNSWDSSSSNVTYIASSMIDRNASNAIVQMPLEISYLHEAMSIEFGLDEKFSSLPRYSRKDLPSKSSIEGQESEAQISSRLFVEQLRFKAEAVHAALWNDFSSAHVKPLHRNEEELEQKVALERRAALERKDEEALQSRLKGAQLNSSEKAMLQNYIAPSRLETSFDDIGSLEHAKEELLSLMVPMSLPVFHQENNLIKTPLGILLYGPPGTGKTMLAKALAKTANASFIHISASSIVAKWLGESEGHAAAVFSLAKKISPCLIFLDEVDGLLHSRDASEHETSRRVKNEFFSGWDGLLSTSSQKDPNMSVTVVAATNRPYDLDSAALRRLPHRVLVNLPDFDARVEIIRKTLRGARIARSDDAKIEQGDEQEREFVIRELATLTDGYSGSDIKSVCTRAAQQHVRDFMKSQNVSSLLQKSEEISPEIYSSDSFEQMEIEEEMERQRIEDIHASLSDKAREFARKPITLKEFNIALGEISASVNQRAGSSFELKKWHETYGSKPTGQRSSAAISSIGF